MTQKFLRVLLIFWQAQDLRREKRSTLHLSSGDHQTLQMAKVHKVTATQMVGELWKNAFSRLPLCSQIQPCLIRAWLPMNASLWYMHKFSGLVWKSECLYNFLLF